MNGVVTKDADGVTYKASGSYWTKDGYLRGKLSGSKSGLSGSIEGLPHLDSQGTYLSGNLKAGGHKSTTGSLNIGRDPPAAFQDPVPLFNTDLKKRQETHSSMTVKHAERNAINRDGQNGSLCSMDWINSLRKIDAKVDTFSTSSHSNNGSAFFASAKIGWITGKANGSFISTDKYLSKKFSGSPSRLLSREKSPGHIPTHDTRVFRNLQAPIYESTTGRWNIFRDPSDVSKGSFMLPNTMTKGSKL